MKYYDFVCLKFDFCIVMANYFRRLDLHSYIDSRHAKKYAAELKARVQISNEILVLYEILNATTEFEELINNQEIIDILISQVKYFREVMPEFYPARFNIEEYEQEIKKTISEIY